MTHTFEAYLGSLSHSNCIDTKMRKYTLKRFPHNANFNMYDDQKHSLQHGLVIIMYLNTLTHFEKFHQISGLFYHIGIPGGILHTLTYSHILGIHFGLLTKYWSNLNILDVLKHSITLQNSQEDISHTLNSLRRNGISSITNEETDRHIVFPPLYSRLPNSTLLLL